MLLERLLACPVATTGCRTAKASGCGSGWVPGLPSARRPGLSRRVASLAELRCQEAQVFLNGHRQSTLERLDLSRLGRGR